jgi:uncharacterized protein (TIGR02300 family)
VGKLDLGTKRICHSCGARFYDLNRDPIACPKCGTTHDPQATLKARRNRSQAAEKAKQAKSVPVLVPDEVELVKVGDEPEEEEAGVIEDAEELGQDDEDVAEVIEKVEEER